MDSINERRNYCARLAQMYHKKVNNYSEHDAQIRDRVCEVYVDILLSIYRKHMSTMLSFTEYRKLFVVYTRYSIRELIGKFIAVLHNFDEQDCILFDQFIFDLDKNTIPTL